MIAKPDFDIVFVGNYTKDTIITTTGRRTVDGGGMNYAGNASVRLGAKTAIITHLSKEDDHILSKLRESGISCFPAYSARSTAITLDYPIDDPDTRYIYVTAQSDPIIAKELDQLKTEWVAIGPSIRGEVGLEFIRYAKARGCKIALDVQGYIRVLTGQELINAPWEEMKSVLPLIDVLKTDAVEAEFLTGKKDRKQAARYFSDLGAREILLTHRDGLQVFSDGVFFDRQFHSSSLIGRSGRGDTCVGSYLASRITKPPSEAATWAAAVTSLKMEKTCPYDRSLTELTMFIERWYNNGNIHNGERLPKSNV